ncbi:MAG: ATP-binding protein [Proteobacteria bacterium]|nr:ATP-binding protein [Pseudomonadota bacterium]
MRSSRLPAVKTLESFDFAFQPSAQARADREPARAQLHRAQGKRRAAGPAGRGKTHLAISLAIAAAQRGRRVYYGTLIDLITSLEEAQAAGHLARRPPAHPSVAAGGR